MKKFALLIILIFAKFASPQLALQKQLYAIKEYISYKQGMILQVLSGKLQRPQKIAFKLKRDRNYQILLLANSNLDELILNIEIYKGAPAAFKKEKFLDMEYYQCRLKTFRSVKAMMHVVSKIPKKNSEYIAILASTGRETPENFVRIKTSDHSGRIYELISGTVYRDGREYYKNKRYDIKSICVTPGGKLYMRTASGVALSKNSGVIYKSHTYKIILMVCAYNERVYMLRNDGAVMGRRTLIYKRSKERRAIDLLENNGNVWILTQDGRRLQQ